MVNRRIRTVLISLFSPSTAADFHYRRDARMAGISTKEYDFSVTHPNSNWSIHIGGPPTIPDTAAPY